MSAILLDAYEGVRYELSFNDNTLRGWLTVLGYLAATALSLRAFGVLRRAAQRAPRASPERRDGHTLSRFWLAMALFMVFLATNKQLDLQTLFIELARVASHEQGWYELRRVAKVAFVLAVAGGALGVIAAGGYALRRVLPQVSLALSGVASIALFVVLRVLAFQHFSRFEGLAHVRTYLFELGGIFIVSLAALRASARRAPP